MTITVKRSKHKKQRGLGMWQEGPPGKPQGQAGAEGLQEKAQEGQEGRAAQGGRCSMTQKVVTFGTTGTQ